MKLIPLDAVLTDIERLKDSVPYFPTIAEKEAYKEGIDGACCKVISLEGKEVDLKEEIKSNYNPVDGLEFEEFESIAKYFFELGMNTSNPLTWQDMMLIHRCIKDAMNFKLYKMMEGIEGQKEVYEEVLKRFKENKRL